MTRERLDRFLEAVFRMRPGEAGTTFLMFLQCMCAVGAFIVGRSVRDALFLAHADKSRLPYVYVLSAFAVAAAAYFYSRLIDRTRRDVLTAATTGVLAVTVLGLRALIAWAEEDREGRGWVYTAVYVWVEVFGALAILTFWSFANEIFNSREAKRLFGIIGAGGTLSNVIMGLAVSVLSKELGAANLLYLCAGLLAGSVGLGWVVAGRVRGRFARVRVAAAPRSSKQGIRMRQESNRVFSSPHLRTVACLVALTFIVTTLVDFQFKIVAKAAYQGQPEAMAAFFGQFYAATGLASLFIQFGVTNRLLERFGIIAALAVLPLGLFAGSSVLAFQGVLWAASMAKGADNVFRYTVNDATMQLLYLPVPSASRGRAKAFIDGILKPGSIALAGLMLAGYQALTGDVGPIAWASLVLLLGWGGLLFGLRSQYVDSLRETLRRRRLDLENARHAIADDSTAKMLRKALAAPDADEVENALELLPDVPNADFDADVAPLLEHEVSRIRRLALDYLSRRGNLRYGNQILKRFDDTDDDVRAAAIRAFCAIGREKAIRNVRVFLTASQPKVQAAAIAGMIKFGGLDGVLAAGEVLKQLFIAQEPIRRATSARVLGEIGVRNFYQPLLDLMADPDVAVRRESIAAAGKLKSQELIPSLVYRLATDDTATDAVSALAEYGPSIESTLGKVIANEQEEPWVRRNVPRVLGLIGDAGAVQILQRHLSDSDEALRRRVYKALVRVLRRRPELKIDRRLLHAALDLEIVRAWRALAAAEELGLGAGGKPPATLSPGRDSAAWMLGSALSEKVGGAVRRIFLLLQVLYPAADLDVAESGLRDELPVRRANALELLDNVLDARVNRRLLPLLDDTARDAKLRAAADWFPPPRLPAEVWVGELLQDESTWVQACALAYAGRTGLEDAMPLVADKLRSLEPVVREAAVVAATELAPHRASELLGPLGDDEALIVRRQVERALAPEVRAAS